MEGEEGERDGERRRGGVGIVGKKLVVVVVLYPPLLRQV